MTNTPDHVVYIISQPYLSARRQAKLAEALCAAAPVPAQLVRLEGASHGTLGDALEAACAAGARRILVQPVGVGFSDSLAAWIPGVLAHWLENNAPPETEAFFSADQSEDAQVIAAIAASTLTAAESAKSARSVTPALGKPGWSRVSPIEHHLLVCAGARCQFHDAPKLRTHLQAALREAGCVAGYQVTEMGCAGPCNLGPLVAHYPHGRWYSLPDRGAVREFVQQVLVNEGEASHLEVHRVGPDSSSAGNTCSGAFHRSAV